MELLFLKKSTLFSILITALLLSTSFAGGQMRYVPKTAVKTGMNARKTLEKAIQSEEVTVHDRLLRANTKDYGSYDPAPALGKPPFKLIPN